METENTNGPMDSDARADAALAAFSGEEPSTTDPNAADPNATDANAADPNAADPNAVDPNADPNAAAQITEEQLNADPRFQELSTLRDNLVNTFSDFPGLVDDKGAPNLDEAKAQLSDASVLYQIMQGKGTPSDLLEVMGKNAGWTDGQKKLVADDLIGWLTKGGYLKGGEAAAAKKPGEAGFKDPVTERLDKLENDRKTEAQRAEQEKVARHQQQVFDTKFMPEMKRLCKQKGVPEDDLLDYVGRVAAEIKGNKVILGRIEQGNFVDVQKSFAKIHNAEVARLQRWTKAQTAAKAQQAKNPRIPAGGAPPAPAGSARAVNPKDRDSRIAAAADML